MQTTTQKTLIGTVLVILMLLTVLLLFMCWGGILDQDGTYRPDLDLVKIIAFGFVAYFRWIWLSIFPSPKISAACEEPGHSHDHRSHEQLERLTHKPQLASRSNRGGIAQNQDRDRQACTRIANCPSQAKVTEGLSRVGTRRA